MRATWWLDGGCFVGSYIAGQATNVQPPTYAVDSLGNLPAFNLVAAASNALVYTFDPRIDALAAQSGGYTAIANLHDQFRINMFHLSMKCNSSPKMQLTTTLPVGPSNLVDFTGDPQYQPDVTWLDYDGIAGLRNGTGYLVPANGDVTNFVGNYYKRRARRAFGSWRMSMRPRCMMQTIQQGANPIAIGAPSYPVCSNVNPWMTNFNNGPFFGRIWFAISYKGPEFVANFQPKYNLSFRTGYDMSMRSRLFG